MTDSTFEPDALSRKIRKQTLAIAMLGLFNMGSLAYFLFLPRNHDLYSPSSQKFRLEVPDQPASDGVDSYAGVLRQTTLTDTRGVIFSPDDIKKFVDSTYKAIVERHAAHMGTALPPKYAWKIGFYWTVRDDETDPKKKRPAFYVTPLLYDSGSKKVLDYFKSTTNRYYNHPAEGSNDPKNIFDEGQLWP